MSNWITLLYTEINTVNQLDFNLKKNVKTHEDMFKFQAYSLSPVVQSLIVSDSLGPRGLQHAQLPCPLPSPRVCSNSRPSRRWCHPTISSSVVPFFARLQFFPASGSFPMSRFSVSGAQSIRVSASASVLPMNSQGWFPLGWTSWIFLLSKGLSKVSSSITFWKHQFFGSQPSLWSSSHIHSWLLEKP